MKIGILTFHSQLNYGGVLQCWALVQALKGMGHEVVVIDRWVTPDNSLLDGPFGHAGVLGWLSIALHVMAGCGSLGGIIRHWRTRRFVKALGLTPYHFYDWKDAPKELGIDCLIVGSDQVWHGGDWGWPTPEPYLLKGAPRVRAIAYAASFGMKALPPEYDYAAGFRRFSAISVREAEGVALVASQGSRATHVVDPTLLLPPSEWSRLGRWKRVPRRLVCYFLSQDVSQAVKVLEPWTRKNNCTVEVLCDSAPCKPFPRTIRDAFRRILDIVTGFFHPHHVRICSGYGPREFVRAFARADMCITDSFHAVMFSSVFDCNIRFLRPKIDSRRAMFARIEEFAEKHIVGDMFVNGVDHALSSFDSGVRVSFRQDGIATRRSFSEQWLREALS